MRCVDSALFLTIFVIRTLMLFEICNDNLQVTNTIIKRLFKLLIMKYSKILLEDPLFTRYDLNTMTTDEILNLLFHNSQYKEFNKFNNIDSYCILCKKHTTFISEDNGGLELKQLYANINLPTINSISSPHEKLVKELVETGIFIRTFKCPRHPRDNSHNQTFIFKLAGTTLIKIGQFPSIADLSNEEIKKYQRLDKNIYSELNRAIGLSSHGIGVGSFVYLRRIIENYIVQPKLDDLIRNERKTESELNTLDFKSKINFIKDELPEFLIKNNKIYSVLSKGIHQLSEEECRDYFPILKTSIEIILDEQIEKIEMDKKNIVISRQISDLV